MIIIIISHVISLQPAAGACPTEQQLVLVNEQTEVINSLYKRLVVIPVVGESVVIPPFCAFNQWEVLVKGHFGLNEIIILALFFYFLSLSKCLF